MITITLVACSKEENKLIETHTYEGNMHALHTMENPASFPITHLDTIYAHTVEITRINDSIEVWNNFCPPGCTGSVTSRTYYYPVNSEGTQIEFWDESLGGYIWFRLYTNDSLYYKYVRSERTPSDVVTAYWYTFTGVGVN